jgi:hypothetical protein
MTRLEARKDLVKAHRQQACLVYRQSILAEAEEGEDANGTTQPDVGLKLDRPMAGKVCDVVP